MKVLEEFSRPPQSALEMGKGKNDYRATKGGGEGSTFLKWMKGLVAELLSVWCRVGEKMNPQNSCFAEPPITPASLNLFSNFLRAITPILTPKIQ